jgi:hypothetical protein
MLFTFDTHTNFPGAAVAASMVRGRGIDVWVPACRNTSALAVRSAL